MAETGVKIEDVLKVGGAYGISWDWLAYARAYVRGL
jgi:hypothetical protein